MQRKNGLLNALGLSVWNIFRRKMFTGAQNRAKGTTTKYNKKPAFAMISAIIIMLVVASIATFTLMQTSQSIKKTADIYLYEQAELYTKSAIEYALFEIGKSGCIDNLHFTLDTIYHVNIDMRYSYTATPAGCTGFATVTSPQQNGSVLMDITVQVNANDTGSDPLRYFRRTMQKL